MITNCFCAPRSKTLPCSKTVSICIQFVFSTCRQSGRTVIVVLCVVVVVGVVVVAFVVVGGGDDGGCCEIL